MTMTCKRQWPDRMQRPKLFHCSVFCYISICTCSINTSMIDWNRLVRFLSSGPANGLWLTILKWAPNVAFINTFCNQSCQARDRRSPTFCIWAHVLFSTWLSLSAMLWVFLIWIKMQQVFKDAASQASKSSPAPGSTPPPQGAPLGQGGKDTMQSFEV